MGSSILICPMCCGETFDDSQSLKYHLLSMTDNLYCPGCSKRLDSIESLIEHLDKCNQEENINLVMESDDFNVEENEVLMDTNVDMNSSFLTAAVNNQVMIVSGGGGSKTIEVDENGAIKFVEKVNLNDKCDRNNFLKLENSDEQSMDINDTNFDDVDPEIGPTISIPESNDHCNSNNNVMNILSDETTDFLETEDNFIDIKQESSDIVEEELKKVKRELREVKNHQIDLSTVYNCSSCGMSFSSVLEHIKQYHDGQEVVLEMSDELMKSPELSTLKNCAGGGGSGSGGGGGVASRPRPRQTMNTIRTEECLDNEGRLYTRKVVQIERFSDKNSNNSITNNVELKSGLLMEKFLTNVDGMKVKSNKINDSTPQRMYRCNQCLEQFPRLTEFRTHPCLNGSNQCDQCNQAFATLKALQLHSKIHNIDDPANGQKSFICKVCGTEFTSHKSLRLHSRMHAPVRERHVDAPEGIPTNNFTCLECGKVLSESYREAHMSLHAGDTVTCAICNRKFDSADSLAMHAAVHPELGIQNQQNYQDINEGMKSINQQSVLPISFATTSTTTSTTTTATNNFDDLIDPLKPYQCQHCGRRFSRPHEKVKHERIHTGEKPHACEVCGKTFRVSYCLTLHMRTHTGVRPYQCQHCGKRFKASSVYNHHLLTHGDERAYTCPYCPKTFKTRVQLAGHKNSHTKPFRCTECSRPFASLYAARAHMQTHKKDNNLKFSCVICGASYGRAFALKDHLKIHDTNVIMPPEPAREEEINEDFLLEEEEIISDELVNPAIQVTIEEVE